MQQHQYINEFLTKQPGWCGTGDVCLLAHKQLTRMTVNIGVQCVYINNEQFHSYESDLDMT